MDKPKFPRNFKLDSVQFSNASGLTVRGAATDSELRVSAVRSMTFLPIQYQPNRRKQRTNTLPSRIRFGQEIESQRNQAPSSAVCIARDHIDSMTSDLADNSAERLGNRESGNDRRTDPQPSYPEIFRNRDPCVSVFRMDYRRFTMSNKRRNL